MSVPRVTFCMEFPCHLCALALQGPPIWQASSYISCVLGLPQKTWSFGKTMSYNSPASHPRCQRARVNHLMGKSKSPTAHWVLAHWPVSGVYNVYELFLTCLPASNSASPISLGTNARACLTCKSDVTSWFQASPGSLAWYQERTLCCGLCPYLLLFS